MKSSPSYPGQPPRYTGENPPVLQPGLRIFRPLGVQPPALRVGQQVRPAPPARSSTPWSPSAGASPAAKASRPAIPGRCASPQHSHGSPAWSPGWSTASRSKFALLPVSFRHLRPIKCHAVDARDKLNVQIVYPLFQENTPRGSTRGSSGISATRAANTSVPPRHRCGSPSRSTRRANCATSRSSAPTTTSAGKRPSKVPEEIPDWTPARPTASPSTYVTKLLQIPVPLNGPRQSHLFTALRC